LAVCVNKQKQKKAVLNTPEPRKVLGAVRNLLLRGCLITQVFECLFGHSSSFSTADVIGFLF